MITPSQWNSLAFLRPGDFSHPDGMVFSAVNRLDRLAQAIGRRPLILSDKRDYDESSPNSQHFYGLAIDSTWPGVNALDVIRVTEESGLYANDGFGAYVNEGGVASFHHDTRGKRARWGGLITHPMSSSLGRRVKRIEYTAIDEVVNLLSRGVGAAVQAIADLPVEKKSLGIVLILAIGATIILQRRH